MKFSIHILSTLWAICLSLMIGVRGSTTVTLYEVPFPTQQPSPTISISEGVSYTASPVSTNADGMTVYEEILVITEVVAYNSLFTSTLLPPGSSNIATTRTFVEGASSYAQTWTAGTVGLSIVFAESCSFQGTTQGACVDINQVNQPGSTGSSMVTSFTGVPTPVYTLVESSGVATRWAGGLSFGGLITLMAVLATWGTALWA